MPARTKSGRRTAYADVKAKLKRRYHGNDAAVYGTLNKIGLIKGSKITAKGRKAAKRKR